MGGMYENRARRMPPLLAPSAVEFSCLERSAGGWAMALLTLGRQAVRTEAIARKNPPPPDPTQIAAARTEAGDNPETLATELAKTQNRLDVAQQQILDRLTPWIPGDFLVVYGGLLTAWTTLRKDFPWLVGLAFGLAFAFVFGAAFATTGFRKNVPTVQLDVPIVQLLVRSVVGGAVSLAAATAIPNSGWYDFKGFVDNELSWVFTVSLLLGLFVLILLGLQKLTGIKLQRED
jgi:hypothetical protein